MKSALKPLVRSLLLVLGLSPVATLSAESLSDTTSTRKGVQQPATTTSVFTGTVVQNTHYAPQLNLGGFYGTQGNSYSEVDVWLPLWQTADQVVYGDVRYQKEENMPWDIALGGGYRWLSDDMSRLYDVYGFYNSYTSSYNNQFQQIMVGGSVRNADWTLRGNYYASVGPVKYVENSLDSLSFKSLGGIQYAGLITYGFEENSINGGVIEIGRTIPYAYVTGLSLFGGYYGFASTAAHPFINGLRVRAEYALDEAFNFSTPFLRHTTLESMVQYDNVNKGVFTIGARFDIPLGKSSTNSKLQDAMMDYVHFYPRAVQSDVTYTTPVTYKQNGQTVIFDIVNTQAEFVEAMMDGSNVVVVNNDIQFEAPQTLGDETSITGQALADNQYITGQNFEYAPGEFINLTGKESLPTLTAAENSNLFILGQNNTLRDMNLVVSPKITGAPFYYTLTTNTNNETVGTLLVDNITTNGYVKINVGDTTTNSNISITNSTFTLENQVNDIISNGAINISTVNGSSMVVDNISGNTIIFENNVTQGYGIFFGNSGTQTIGSVDSNTVTFGGSATTSRGIVFGNSNTGTQTIGSTTNNTVNFEDIATSSIGIYSYNADTTGTQTIGSTTNNTVSFNGTATGSQGISFSNFNAQTIASTTNNTVNFNATATGSQGIYLSSNLSSTMSAGDIKNNMITFTGAVINSSGIFLNFNAQNNIALTVGLIDSNTINFKGGADASSQGINIYMYDYAATLSIDGINNNTISFGSNSTGAKAIIVNNHAATGSGEDSLTVNGMYGNNIITESGNGIYLATYTPSDSLVINIAQPGVTNTNDVAGLSAANHGSFVNTQNVVNDTLTINGAAG